MGIIVGSTHINSGVIIIKRGGNDDDDDGLVFTVVKMVIMMTTTRMMMMMTMVTVMMMMRWWSWWLRRWWWDSPWWWRWWGRRWWNFLFIIERWSSKFKQFEFQRWAPLYGFKMKNYTQSVFQVTNLIMNHSLSIILICGLFKINITICGIYQLTQFKIYCILQKLPSIRKYYKILIIHYSILFFLF